MDECPFCDFVFDWNKKSWKDQYGEKDDEYTMWTTCPGCGKSFEI